MTDKLKKQLILNLTYLIFVYLFDKLCQGVRLSPGAPRPTSPPILTPHSRITSFSLRQNASPC